MKEVRLMMSKEKKQKLYLVSLIVGFLTGVGLYFLIQNKIDILWMVSFTVVMLIVYWLIARKIVASKKSVSIPKSDLSKSATTIFNALGVDNVVSIDHCQTRVKVTVKDSNGVDVAKIRSAGIQGVIKPSNTSVHLVAKELVNPLYEALMNIVESR